MNNMLAPILLSTPMLRDQVADPIGAKLLDTDRYVSMDKVRDVADDRVRLSVRRDELIKEE